MLQRQLYCGALMFYVRTTKACLALSWNCVYRFFIFLGMYFSCGDTSDRSVLTCPQVHSRTLATCTYESPRLYRRPLFLGGWFQWVSVSGIHLSSGSGL